MKRTLLAFALLCVGLAFGQTPVNSSGTVVTGNGGLPSGVTSNGVGSLQANGSALGYSGGTLARFLNGPLYAKKVMWSGDSTVAVAPQHIGAMCLRTGTGQEFDGIQCAPMATYSIDGSHNVTGVVTGSLPSNCTVGAYVSINNTSTANTNMVGATTPTFQITAVDLVAKSFTYNNSLSAGVTGSTATDGYATCSILNNGSNGQTQAGFNTATGVGSLAFTNSIKPDLDIHRGMGINDVRGGSTSQTQLIASIKAYIDSVRSNSSTTDIVLDVPNSLLATDSSAAGWVTSASTTSSTAVAAPGSVTITLGTMLNSIAGLITPDLTIAQQAANTQTVTVTPTTGTITHGTASLVVVSATGFLQGMVIKVVGAGPSGADLITQIQTISGTTFTIAPQASTDVAGAAVTQEATVYSAHLLVDTAGSQEIVPITAIDTANKTVTATFGLAHSGGFTVIPTMATMAQSYSNILHDAVMSFVGYTPNVIVVDLQSQLYGRLVQDTTSAMTNQLHPSGIGYDFETDIVAGVVNQIRQAGLSQGTSQKAPIPTVRYSSLEQYQPLRALAAIQQNYTAPWKVYLQAVEHPDYFTLVCSGALNSYSSTSYLRISQDANSLATNGSYGVCPAQPYDVVEYVGYGVVQLTATSGASNTSGYTNISVPGTIPWTMPAGTPIRVYRAKYVDVTAEVHAKSPIQYKTVRYANVTNSGATAFYFSILSADPNQLTSPALYTFNPATDKLVVQGVGDLSTIVTNYTTMTCTLNVGQYYCSGGGSVPTMSNAYGQVFYSDKAEDVAREQVSKNASVVMTPNGAWMKLTYGEEQITLSTSGATTDSSANLLPANSLILGVSCRVTTTITTATAWTVGDASTAARFIATGSALTANTIATNTGTAWNTGIASATTGFHQASAAKLRITTTGTPGAGVVRCSVFSAQAGGPNQ